MHLALQYRQAIKMRTNAAGEHRGAVVEQVLRRNRGGDVGAAGSDEVGGFPRGDVFHHHF